MQHTRPPLKNVPLDEPNVDSATDREMSHAQLARTLFLRWERIHSITSSRERTEYSSQNPTGLFTPLFSLNVVFQAFLLIESLLPTPITFNYQELCLVQNRQLFFLRGVFPPKSVRTATVDKAVKTHKTQFYVCTCCCMIPADTAFTANSIRMEILLPPFELYGVKPHILLFSITYPKCSKINSWAYQNYGSCFRATVTSQPTTLQLIVYKHSLEVYYLGYGPSGFGLLRYLPQPELNIPFSQTDGI